MVHTLTWAQLQEISQKGTIYLKNWLNASEPTSVDALREKVRVNETPRDSAIIIDKIDETVSRASKQGSCSRWAVFHNSLPDFSKEELWAYLQVYIDVFSSDLNKMQHLGDLKDRKALETFGNQLKLKQGITRPVRDILYMTQEQQIQLRSEAKVAALMARNLDQTAPEYSQDPATWSNQDWGRLAISLLHGKDSDSLQNKKQNLLMVGRDAVQHWEDAPAVQQDEISDLIIHLLREPATAIDPEIGIRTNSQSLVCAELFDHMARRVKEEPKQYIRCEKVLRACRVIDPTVGTSLPKDWTFEEIEEVWRTMLTEHTAARIKTAAFAKETLAWTKLKDWKKQLKTAAQHAAQQPTSSAPLPNNISRTSSATIALPPKNGKRKRGDKDSTGSAIQPPTDNPSQGKDSGPAQPCPNCGNAPHKAKHNKCPYIRSLHRDVNNDKLSNSDTYVPWADSDKGKLCRQQQTSQPESLRWDYHIDGSKRQIDETAFKATQNKGSHPKGNTFTCVQEIVGIIPYTSIAQIIHTNDIPCNFPATICNLIPLHNREEGTRKKRKVNTQERKLKSCLADTGAVQANYISIRLAKKLVSKYNVSITPTQLAVKTAIRGSAIKQCLGSISIDVSIRNELTNADETISITALIIDTDYDLIIGRPTIREHGLLTKCHNQILYGGNPKQWPNNESFTKPNNESFTKPTSKDSQHETLIEGVDKTQPNKVRKLEYDNNNHPKIMQPPAPRSQNQPNHTSTKSPKESPRRSHKCIGCSLTHSTSVASIRACERLTHEDPVAEGTRQGTSTTRANPSPYVCMPCMGIDRDSQIQQRSLESDENELETPNDHFQHEDFEKFLTELQDRIGTTEQEDDLTDVDESVRLSDNISRTGSANIADTRQRLHQWQTSLNAIGPATTGKKTPNPVVPPLPNVKRGDIINSTRLLQREDDGTDESDMIHDDNPVTSKINYFDNDEYLDVKVAGSDDLQKRIKALVKAYRDIFSATIPSEPARVSPLEFGVNTEDWYSSANRATYRRQSVLKDQEIGLQIEIMEENGTITRSNATAWSQVLLTPKSNLKWRFCIDFRQLNATMKNKGWPLPRIQEVLQRIGHQQSTIFGKMDLTSGYHQTPLSANSRSLTAFITSHGLFEWNRVPMGLKNAAAYFQEVMASEVLNGLVNHILEVYLDDVVTHASTEDQFVERLELIFERFRLYNIKVSPTKCEFGTHELEVLGHTIDGSGIHFSREKLEGVNGVTLPQTGTQLHSFLGLANYFRNHVNNVHVLEQPLRQILKQYPGSRRITWLPTSIAAFEKLKTAVWQCSTLFFVDYNAPVYLHTDACNTGIGAYLFQIVDGQERPIGFLSKSLTGAQLNWSTFEQEGYAIHQALKKFEYILRDIKFTLRTDHRNLLYINEKASPKVLRWKLDIQQFNFDVEHIPGPENVVADLYSRLTTLQSVTNNSNEWTETWRSEIPPPYQTESNAS